MTPFFTKEVKLRWIDALRNGSYQQCKTYLHDGNSYCALGVLADVTNNLVFDEEFGVKVFKDVKFTISLPDSFFPFFHQAKIIGLSINGKTFNEIADYIETNVPHYEETV